MKLLIVVHRYFPYAGGSEYACQTIAEGAVKQGHDVTVLTDKGESHNGVKVTNMRSVALDETWDLIFVHGSCPTQDFIHVHAETIVKKSPIYYLLVEPSDHPLVLHGMKHATFIGWNTSHCLLHIEKNNYSAKGRQFLYSIDTDRVGRDGFKERYGITTQNMFISVGGFWEHKRMFELKDAFLEANRPDTTLVLMGYDVRHGNIPPQSEFVKCIHGADYQDVLDGIYEADLYISNSRKEGYGLVLLESMYNLTPWASTNVGAAGDLKEYGHVFEDNELVSVIRNFEDHHMHNYDIGWKYVLDNHSPAQSVKCLEDAVKSL